MISNNLNVHNKDKTIDRTMDIIKIALNGYFKMYVKPDIININNLDKVKIKMSNNDIDDSKMSCYKNEKLLYNGFCSFIGILKKTIDPRTKNTVRLIWHWGWSVPGASKSFTSKTLNLLNYSLISFDDYDELLSQIKQYMINASSNINDIIDIEIILALVIYLTKIKILIGIPVSHDEYIAFAEKLHSKDTSIIINKNINKPKIDNTKNKTNIYEYVLYFSLT